MLISLKKIKCKTFVDRISKNTCTEEKKINEIDIVEDIE